MLVENRDFFIPAAFGAQVRWAPSEYCHPFGVKILEWWSHPTVKKNFDDMNNRLDRIPARDGQTDRRTDIFLLLEANTRRS